MCIRLKELKVMLRSALDLHSRLERLFLACLIPIVRDDPAQCQISKYHILLGSSCILFFQRPEPGNPAETTLYNIVKLGCITHF